MGTLRRGPAWLAMIIGLLLVLAACTTSDGGADASGGGGDGEATADYPSEDLQIMAPADPGGGWDSTARAMQPVLEEVGSVGAEVYNVGGGVRNTISLLDLLGYLEKRVGRPISVTKQPWRPGDQRCFIADTSKAQRELGWTAKTSWQAGLDKLYDWVASNPHLFNAM